MLDNYRRSNASVVDVSVIFDILSIITRKISSFVIGFITGTFFSAILGLWFQTFPQEQERASMSLPVPREFYSVCIRLIDFRNHFSVQSVEIVTTSIVEAEIVDWGVKLYALKPSTTERLEKFSVSFQLNYLGEFTSPYDTL